MNKTIKQLAEAYAAACKEEAQDLLRALGKIPAPTHREDLRAAFCRDWFLRQGAEDVSIDWAKNVICKLGPRDGELVVFAAHTDIVFPDTESLPMTEADGKLCAPGIGDDTANLVNLMMAAKYLLQARPALKCGIPRVLIPSGSHLLPYARTSHSKSTRKAVGLIHHVIIAYPGIYHQRVTVA